jgi:peptidoglycan/LPS O-acetylase OafA/YrhL
MKRIAELDGLRGIAAIMIVAFHFSQHTVLYDRIFYVGSVSLELFFVLSGYLISCIILVNADKPGFLQSFYIRRSLRIWPIYYLAVLAFIVIVALRPGIGSLRAAANYLTFTQNIQSYWFAETPILATPLVPTWSLAVEEQFYILWPMIVLLLGRRWMVPFALACIALAFASRVAGFSHIILITNCDGFALGGLLAVAITRGQGESGHPGQLTRRLAVGLAVSLVYLMVAMPVLGLKPFEMTHGLVGSVSKTVVCCFFACVIGMTVCCSGSRFLAPLRAGWLRYIGLISYGIYLYHMIALMIAQVAVGRLRMHPSLTGLVVAPALTLAMASASWAWFEKPILRLKDRFRYGRAVATPTNTPEPTASLTTP